MSEGLIIGYDLTRYYCRVSYFKEGEEEPVDVLFSDEKNPYLIQNSICRRKGTNEWLVGRSAYETALLGQGSIVDKLLLLVERKDYSTFDGELLSAGEIFRHFLEETLKRVYQETGEKGIRYIIFTVQELDAIVLDTIIEACKELGIERNSVRIISHTESFLFYALSRKQEFRNNLSVLFDFTGDGLNYYELEIVRGMQPNAAVARRKFLEEGFSVDIMNSPMGHRMADSILTSCTQRILDKKLVSICLLSGNGMDDCQTWGTNFLRTLCARRRVFFVENVFAKGAVYAAVDALRQESAYPFRILCEGRIRVDISTEIFTGLSQQTVFLARAGENWYDTKAEFDVIPDDMTKMLLKVKKLGDRTGVVAEVPLADILKGRANKTTRIGVQLRFTSENVFTVTLEDKGFGEFYPASGRKVYRTFPVE